MRWHDLLAGLDGARDRPGSTGDPDVEVASITHDSRRRRRPARCFACIPGAVTDGHDHAADAVGARRGRAARRARRCRSPVAAGPGRRACAPRSGPVAATLYGDPSGRDAGARRHRHQRQDHHDATCSRRSRGPPATASASIGTVGARDRRRRRRAPARTPRPRRPSCRRCSRACATPASATVAMEVSSHALAPAPRRRHARSPRCASPTSRTTTSTTTARSTPTSRPRRALFDAARSPRAPRSTSTTRTAASSPSARPRRRPRRRGPTASTTPTADVGVDRRRRSSPTRHARHARRASPRRRRRRCVDSPLVGRSTSRTRSRPPPPRWPPGSPFDAVAAGLGAPPVGARAGSSGSTPASRSPCSSTTRTRPTRSSTVLAGRPRAGAAPAAGCVVVFGCGGDRDRAKRPVMGAAAAAAADVVVSRPTTRAPRTRRRSPTRSLAGLADAGRRCGRRARPPRRDPRARSPTAAPGDVVVIAGKGHETGPDHRRAHACRSTTASSRARSWRRSAWS